MFFANTLKEKYKDSLSQFEVQTEPNKCVFPYTKKPKPPQLLIIAKKTEEPYQLEELSIKERLNKFTISKLRDKWNEKFNVNFDKKFKKFSVDCINDRAKSAKIYINELVSKDLFSKPKPRWNIATTLNQKAKDIPLETALFNITQGLNSFNVVTIKEKEEVPDTQNNLENENEIKWNKTTKLENNEKKLILNEISEKAMNNTQKYWNKTSYGRLNEDEFRITEERKKVEEPRYYKKYKDPMKLTQYNYDKMNEVKEKLWLETEETVQIVKKEYPWCEKLEEKINSIVQKRMSNIYNEQFDLFTGKKKEKKKDQRNYVWRDNEIIDKIHTVYNWNDISWFKPSQTPTSQYADVEAIKKKELLNSLLTKGVEISKAENIIKEQKKSELKKVMKNQLFQQKCNQLKLNIMEKHLKQSKYPLSEKDYQNIMKSQETQHEEVSNKEDQAVAYIDNNFMTNEEYQGIDKECFLEAYKKIVVDSNNNKKKNGRKPRVKNSYCHLGTYVSIIIHISIYRETLYSKKTTQQRMNKWIHLKHGHVA